jgi:hypothetical protein
MKLEFSIQIFEKYSNTKFYENPSSGRQVIACGQMGRYDETIRCPSQFCKSTGNTYIN